MEKLDKLYECIFGDYKVVVITGAGISTLSGIPDFRGDNGLYSKGDEAAFMLSFPCFKFRQEAFYNFYKDKMMKPGVKPNIIHEVLAKLEERGLINCIITQNIDGLHSEAGSKNVVELHGNGNKFYCVNCFTSHNVSHYLESNKCKICGGIVRPDIVLYNECVKYDNGEDAFNAVYEADKIIVLGSTLSVPTVANLVRMFINHKVDFSPDDLFIINKGRTWYDGFATTFDEDLGDVIKKIKSCGK